MSRNEYRQSQHSLIQIDRASKDFEQAANEICERALEDAQLKLHPLIREAELDHLDKRHEFVQAFKSALERRIAKRLVTCQPGIQAVFKFDGPRLTGDKAWDGTIHLLVKVPRLSDRIRALGKALDRGLRMHLRQLGWSRFQEIPAILDIQQVTTREMRHGIGYGAMFCAVYTVPVKVWPADRHPVQQPHA